MSNVKSLLHFEHTKIGSKTHKPKTATAHLKYVMRQQAMSKFQCENMPEQGRAAREFFDNLALEAGTNKEVRICDKFIIALPLEATREERHELIATFMHKLGKGRIPWCAAHHDQGEDAHNPHAHVTFKDRDVETGKKVIGFGTSKRDVNEAVKNGWKVPPRMTSGQAREAWCQHLNEYMRSHGYAVQYDHRSHKDRGLEQEATIHEGAKVHALKEKGIEPKSKDRLRNDRLLQYSLTDAGTRIEHNRRVQEANLRFTGKDLLDRDRMASTSKPQTREQREKRELYQAHGKALRDLWHQQKLDREALRHAHGAEKNEQRAVGRERYNDVRQQAYDQTKQQTAATWRRIYGMPKGRERETATENSSERRRPRLPNLSACRKAPSANNPPSS